MKGAGDGRRARPFAHLGGARDRVTGVFDKTERAQSPPEAIPFGRHPVELEQSPVGHRASRTRQGRSTGEPREGRDQRGLVRLADGQARALAPSEPGRSPAP